MPETGRTPNPDQRRHYPRTRPTCPFARRRIILRRNRRTRGIILADTKFEFGTHGAKLLLIDEVLTPDSPRFWPMDEYRVGSNPPSFDKQFLRDYLDSLDWPKTPPPPPIPENIVGQSQARYFEAYRRITGRELTV